MSLRCDVARATGTLSDIFGIAFALSAFGPMAILGTLLPFEGNIIREYAVLIIGLIPLAPLSLLFFILEHSFIFISNWLSNNAH